MIYKCGHCGYVGHCYGAATGWGATSPYCPKCQKNDKLTKVRKSCQKLKAVALSEPSSYLEIQNDETHCYHCDCGRTIELAANLSTIIWQCRCGRRLMKTGCDVQILQSERQWNNWKCTILNLIDFRYWFCECHYHPTYGLVIMGGCPKHD